MGKVITVWGSPGSGKSMFSCILAKALTRDKRKAIIINAEISVPMLPVWLPEQIIQTNASVGQVLSSVEIDTTLVASHVTVLKSYPFIGLMGYSAGENPLSYPEVKYAMVTKNDVDLENNTISVNHNLIYRMIDGKAGFHITTPKTASGTRTIPILYPQVAEQLRTLIEVMDILYPEDLVMNGYHGFLFRNREGYFLSAHNINRAIQRISIAYNAEEMDQAELEDREPELLPHFSVHNLRHTFCTRLCESTNDIKFIQQVMGHADFSTTMDIYTHITQENMEEKVATIKGNLVLM
ncbi:tyrosine-type recombinase/integrase [Intestinimonas butyriciproducens]|uniref:tyrosine-type recombinase/integrase n=1 Tax=Intestinimonas butyriciproducens TaxID=1297617 RepID=UPI001FB024F1|nr:tyrosine-type recombinase/integrase [Intestinimonas butyriciproducens]